MWDVFKNALTGMKNAIGIEVPGDGRGPESVGGTASAGVVTGSESASAGVAAATATRPVKS